MTCSSGAAFTFGATVLASAALRMAANGEQGAVASLAPYRFVGANFVAVVTALATLRLEARRSLVTERDVDAR